MDSSAGGPGFNPQPRTVSYQRRYKNGTSSTCPCLALNIQRGKYLLFLKKTVMDKIWDRKSQDRQKSNAKKIK